MIKEILAFLEELRDNNTREWFTANKSVYDKHKKAFDSFANQLITDFGKVDKDIAYLEPKDCIFRIYRDTRFATDKTPYKTNMGMFMVKGGKSSGNAGYYFHLESTGSFVAGGMYMPMPDVLKKVRREIYDNIDEFLEIVENKEFRKHFPTLDSELKLKTFPKDFPKDFEHIDYLKYKSYTCSKELSDKVLLSTGLTKEIIESFTAIKPFIKFLNNAKNA